MKSLTIVSGSTAISPSLRVCAHCTRLLLFSRTRYETRGHSTTRATNERGGRSGFFSAARVALAVGRTVALGIVVQLMFGTCSRYAVAAQAHFIDLVTIGSEWHPGTNSHVAVQTISRDGLATSTAYSRRATVGNASSTSIAFAVRRLSAFFVGVQLFRSTNLLKTNPTFAQAWCRTTG